MKTGVIDVGGGLRGIYAAGVLDYCMEQGIRFDLGIGISAGSANLASFVACQRGRNYHLLFVAHSEYQHKILQKLHAKCVEEVRPSAEPNSAE